MIACKEYTTADLVKTLCTDAKGDPLSTWRSHVLLSTFLLYLGEKTLVFSARYIFWRNAMLVSNSVTGDLEKFSFYVSTVRQIICIFSYYWLIAIALYFESFSIFLFVLLGRDARKLSVAFIS